MNKYVLLVLGMVLSLSSCSLAETKTKNNTIMSDNIERKEIYFAGGCFWGTEDRKSTRLNSSH